MKSQKSVSVGQSLQFHAVERTLTQLTPSERLRLATMLIEDENLPCASLETAWGEYTKRAHHNVDQSNARFLSWLRKYPGAERHSDALALVFEIRRENDGKITFTGPFPESESDTVEVRVSDLRGATLGSLLVGLRKNGPRSLWYIRTLFPFLLWVRDVHDMFYHPCPEAKIKSDQDK